LNFLYYLNLMKYLTTSIHP